VSNFSSDFHYLCQRDDIKFRPSLQIQNLKAEAENLNKEIIALRRLLVPTTYAESKAKLQYMSNSDKKIFLQFQDAKSRRDNLQKFLTDFEKISADFKNSFAYEEIATTAKNKIRALDSNLYMFQKFFDEVELNLQNPAVKKNINFATHNILNQNSLVRDKLKVALDKLNSINQKLNAELPIASPEQKIFSRDEFLNQLQRPCMRLIDTKNSLLYKKRKLTKKLFTLPRAKLMAENIFVHSELKKLQPKKLTCDLSPDNFTYEKSGDTFPIAKLSSKVSGDDFKKLKVRAKELNGNFSSIVQNFIFHTKADRDTFISDFAPQQIRDFKIVREEYRNLEKHKHKLSPDVFNAKKKSLEEEFGNLRQLCTSSDAQRKILDIAIGILRKNKKFSVAISDIDNKIKSLDVQIDRLTKQMIFAHSNLNKKFNPKDTQKVWNAIQAAHNPRPSLTSLITDTLTEGSKDAAAIGQSADIIKDFDMPTNWNLMSDLKKDEILRKRKRARY